MNVNEYQLMVRNFNQVMGSKYGPEAKDLRVKLLQEESQEAVEAAMVDDPIELIDGLCDTLYVTYGAADTLGVTLPAIPAETATPRKPPLGFEGIKPQLNDFVECVGDVVSAIYKEDHTLLGKRLSDLVRGCWLMASEGLGIDLRPFFLEVHRTNMLKTTGPVREDGKRLKPEGWKPPRILAMYARVKDGEKALCHCRNRETHKYNHPDGGEFCANCGGFHCGTV